MLSRKVLLFSALTLLIMLIMACTLFPVASAPSQSSAGALSITQTALALQQTQVALELTRRAPSLVAPTSPLPQPTAAALPTAAPATPTSQPLPSATLLAPTATPAAPGSGLPGTASGNLYCRTGPAPYYPAIDTMKAGDKVTVIGRQPEGDNYWLVTTPHGKTCWVWGRWLNITGDTASLTIATAPPPPPAAASIRLLRQDTCGNHFLVFSILNQGPESIESYLVRIKDLQTGFQYDNSTMPAFEDAFYRCGSTLPTLKPGKDTEAWIPIGNADTRGHTVQVSLKTCTEDGLSGECIERTPFNVTVP